MQIGLTYNLKKVSPDDHLSADYYAEFDDESTIHAVIDALTNGGNKVIPIEFDGIASSILKDSSLDMVFNIAEGVKGECRESHVPALLELLSIPYTGSNPLTLAISLNKALTNDLLKYYGINAPSYQIFKNFNEPLSLKLKFPIIVKPLYEGSSKGVRDHSLVQNENDLIHQISWVIKNYEQPALAEEYIDGREFTISLLGNNCPAILPIIELDFKRLPRDANKIYSYDAKWIWDTPERPIEMFVCPAKIDFFLENYLRKTAQAVFNILRCRDVCRIDGRLDSCGKFHVLDVNPLPGLIPDPKAHSCLPEAARVAGYTYDELINTILYYALKRYNMTHLLPDTSLVKMT